MVATKDFQEIIQHPESQQIVAKLIAGESPKQVSEYLKIKYHEADQKHLKISAAKLQEFVDLYLNHSNFLHKILEDERQGKIDSKVAASLLDNKAWRDRLANLADDEIDLKKKITSVLHLVEARAEQIFDKIQENPRITRDDYVLVKYFENLCMLIEKADKLLNNRPDQVIQHNVTVQMVEQHSVAFQEAIKDFVKELTPEMSNRFMELLSARLNKMHGNDYGLPDSTPISLEKRKADAEKLLPKFFKEDEAEQEAEFEEEGEHGQ